MILLLLFERDLTHVGGLTFVYNNIVFYFILIRSRGFYQNTVCAGCKIRNFKTTVCNDRPESVCAGYRSSTDRAVRRRNRSLNRGCLNLRERKQSEYTDAQCR